MAEMIRYIFRPQLWFSFYLQQYINNHLTKTSEMNQNPQNENQQQLYSELYASFYLTSETIHSFEKYFEILSYYSPHIQHIFISTDSSLYLILPSLISTIQKLYPTYTYHHLSPSAFLNNDNSQNSFESFLYSVATLEVSSKATTFIGNLHQTWDHLINVIQRTRGDGGYDYHSINSTATSFSICLEDLIA